MKVKDRVLIVLATYNPNRYLYDQIDSILNQTHQCLKIKISDDFSNNYLETKKYIEKYYKKYDILFQRNLENLGYVKNFLYSLRDSDSNFDFFAFSDQDDVWEKRKIEKAIKSLKYFPADVPSLYCGRTAISNETSQVIVGYSPLFRKKPKFSNALIQNIGGGNTMLFNRAAYDLIIQSLENLQNKDVVSHDWWCYQIVSGAGGIVHYDPEASLKYRQHPGNLIGENRTWKAQFSRIGNLLKGRFKTWNDVNCKALQSNRLLLTTENRKILDNFVAARKASIIRRVFLFYKSGVHRQTLWGNIGLIVGIIFNRV